ncbi:G1 family glutamic endopeptidase [Methylobacterium longum]|uniref:G1 family glutamic endopeptidase n=1 Tax=Methylobacterium longum TaxID=767694 RepID=A0ABT8AVH0_9HYPH|nr:G1 family glutamic endopeptidase [Methylobacterium longum]MDN3573938.1 G1 family glutamic endopeptidase [Methylobacterium longum]GJE13578.1 hypothetical protein FOHLNKBM_4642 [Methylobacterium longum]
MTIIVPSNPLAGAPTMLGAGLVNRLRADMQARILPPADDKEQVLGVDFDPEDPTLDLAACLRRGIPPRPQDPAALALWLRMVEPPLTLLPFRAADVMLRGDITHGSFRIAGVSGEGMDAGQEEAIAVFTGGGRLSSSANWSGGAILPRNGERFVQVLASWRVPAVRAGTGAGPWVCSTWIGMDGLRRWMGSMPQMGTTQSLGQIERGSLLPANFPWFQWWLRGQGIQPPVPLPLSISPGSLVYCVVTRLPRNQPSLGDQDMVQFFIRAGSTATYLICKPPPVASPGEKFASHGASAQWILERPTALNPSPNGNVRVGDLFPLPDFSTAGLDDFAASLARTPNDTGVIGSIEAPALTPATPLRAPRLLRMVETLPDPPRTAVIAKPASLDGRLLEVRYRGPG